MSLDPEGIPVVHGRGDVNTYETEVTLLTERVYVAPEKQGERPTVIEVDPETENDALAWAEMPAEAWGWFTQRRLSGSVEVDDTDRELTSLPFDRAPMVWVDAYELDIEDVAEQVLEQEEYRKERDKLRMAYGPLPHGRDQRPTLAAMAKGDRVLVTRTGERRWFAEADRFVQSVDLLPEG